MFLKAKGWIPYHAQAAGLVKRGARSVSVMDDDRTGYIGCPVFAR
jgi:hypothetical protein